MDEIIEALLEAIMKWAEDNKENFDVVVIVPVDSQLLTAEAVSLPPEEASGVADPR